MYSLFLLFINYVIFISALSESTSNNQCDCLRYDSCPKRYLARCISEHEKHEDFYLQNSVSGKYPELCHKWFLEGFIKDLTSPENGIMDTSLYFSPHLFETNTFEVQLRYQEQCSDFETNSTFYLLDLSHSNKYITVEPASAYSCKKVIKLSFPYIFSGCYQLYIKNMTKSEISSGCMTKPFYVNSSYKKTMLHNLTLTTYAVYKSQRQELVYTSVFGNLSEGLNPDSTEVTLKSHVDFSLNDCAGSGNEASKYVVHRGECCHRPLHGEQRNVSNCPCKWDNDMSLTCSFNEIPNGNYCVILKLIDPRCESSTLWTKSETGFANCAWGRKIEAKGQATLQTSEEYEPNSYDYPLIMCLIFTIVGITFAIIFSVYVIKIKKKMHFYTGENNIAISEKSCFINEDYEILLLYPRDCEQFMRSMNQFRTFLKDSCLTKGSGFQPKVVVIRIQDERLPKEKQQYSCAGFHSLDDDMKGVYDPWDEEMFDKVAESIETWSLPFIKNNKIKIIVILTECSKVIEETYIDDKYSFAYRDPKLFDQVFGQSLKAINQYFATRVDSYQRVFVVRLNDSSVVNLSFHLNCATIYILPHCLEMLIHDLQNGNPSQINKENIARLRSTIQEYQRFKHQNPNYLNEIVNIDNNNKIV